ncbi:hypothetical protein JOD31_003162 [Methylopila capsulata]|uniref:Uncharacterized protein n=1 Tax=Methylopila capsulata TaxID=61654 RepID=A0A9W6MTH9_9HYPH|nr:hypothetical protein [Methylopila capsulata]MBM7852920.1 hypothetical protein [Methylopila capsulata]GLK57131.1 hypothetical protein GCM10008170_31500 [Methylopila capsulata]
MAMAGAAPLANERPRVLLQGDDRSEMRLVLFIWLVMALAAGAAGYGRVVEALSTDDAMRLAEVRDFLGGQGWYDLTQRRLNPPDGVFMHWSRLIDLPIAVLLSGFGRLFAEETALRLTLTLWPAIPLLPALVAVASISRALGGRGAAVLGALLFVLSPGIALLYAPGMIDHHGAQLTLALVMLACALNLDRSRAAAIGGGLAGAAMLAIGMETLPAVAAVATAIALRWGCTGDDVRDGAAVFGLAFFGATCAAFLVDVAPSRWLLPVCDALGPAHLAAAAVGGLGLALATRSPGEGAPARFAALGIVGVVVIVTVALIAPDCLGDPYAAVPALVRAEWLDHVAEARTAVAFAATEPAPALALGLSILAGLAPAVWLCLRGEPARRWRIWTGAAVLGVSCLVALWQVRGVTFSLGIGIPFLAAAVVAIARTRGGLALLALNPTTIAVVALGAAEAAGWSAPATGAGAAACPPADYRALRRLTPGLALNDIDSGSYILAFSQLSALAAPYHRNVGGLEAWIEAATGTDETARAVALSRRARYVVVCPTAGVRAEATAHPLGLSGLLLAGATPVWLSPIDLGPEAKLRAYRVAP